MSLASVPQDTIIVDNQRRLTQIYQAWFASIHDWLSPVGQSGTSTNRPQSTSRNQLYIGQSYFDTTLNKPIWVKTVSPAVVWIDATGAVV